jgi:hypothetical protein
MPRVAANFSEIRGNATCLTSCQARQVNRRQFYFWDKFPTPAIHLARVNSHSQYRATSRTVRIICFGCSSTVWVFEGKLVNVCERYLLRYLLSCTWSNLPYFPGDNTRYLHIKRSKFVKYEHARFTVKYFPVDNGRVIYTKDLNS